MPQGVTPTGTWTPSCALFATAARAEERTGGRGALNFLEELDAQDIAADTLSERTVRPDAVRLMTAHRAKGLEWGLVVVAGVQEGLWPDLRRRGSLLEADRIGRDGLAEPLTPGALLAEERRLFYVAATRARERLVVTAVRAPADDGDQPSRFLTELGVEPKDVTGRPRRPLVGGRPCRRTARHHRGPAVNRPHCVRRPHTGWPGSPPWPTTRAGRWCPRRTRTAGGACTSRPRSKVPLRDREQPVALSGSALDQLANTCALQWFLGREVKADAPATAAQGFGNVVHVLADEVASGRTPADLAVLMERLDSVWDALAFDAPWKSGQEKEHARVALERFLRWHVRDRAGRTPVATEHGFDVTLEAGAYEVRIRGSMDRVERDAEGRAYVVDFKTGKRPHQGARSPATRSSPSISSRCAKARSTRSSTACARRRAAPNWSSCGQAARQEGGRRGPPEGPGAGAAGGGVGRGSAGHRGRQGPGRTFHAHDRPATARTARSAPPAARLPEGRHIVE